MGGARGPGGGPVAPPPPRSPPRPTLLGSPGSGPAVPLRSDPPSPDLPPTRPRPPPPPRPPQVGGSPPAPPHGRAQGWGRGRLREALRRPPLNRVSSVGLPPNYPQLCPQSPPALPSATHSAALALPFPLPPITPSSAPKLPIAVPPISLQPNASYGRGLSLLLSWPPWDPPPPPTWRPLPLIAPFTLCPPDPFCAHSRPPPRRRPP